MGMFDGKKILVLGVANKKSIAWAISEALQKEGAELAFTYVNEAIEKRIRPLAEQVPNSIVLPCDVQSDEEITNLFSELKERWGSLDGVIHSVAYAEREDLDGRFIETSREGFKTALDVSAYSLIAVAKGAEEMLKESKGSILTMSYLGAVRVIPNYKVMGVAKAALESSVRYLAADLGEHQVRVNAISAGPLRTLAASGIPRFRELMAAFAERAPMKRNVTLEDVAGTALYFLSDLASGVTGEVAYVDCGYSVTGG